MATEKPRLLPLLLSNCTLWLWLQPPIVTEVAPVINVWAEAWKGAVNASAAARKKAIFLRIVCAASMVFLDSLDNNRAQASVYYKNWDMDADTDILAPI